MEDRMESVLMNRLYKKISLCIVAYVCALSALYGAGAEGYMPKEGRWSVGVGWENEWPASWAHAKVDSVDSTGEWMAYYGSMEFPGGVLKLRDVERQRKDGLIEVRRRWEWLGESNLDRVTLSVRMQVSMKKGRPFMPSVNYYNNPAGQSIDTSRIPVIDPKGGKGYYEEHRFSMPVSAVEGVAGKNTVIAGLHSLPSPIFYGNLQDQWWSLGMEHLSDDLVEMALYSGAVSSNGRNGIIKAKQREWLDYKSAWVNLKPGAVVDKIFFVQPEAITKRGAGFQLPIKASLELFDNTTVNGYTPYKEILQLKFNDTMSRWREGENYSGVDAFPGEDRPWIDLGWAGQSEAAPYALLLLGEEYGVKNSKEMAQKAMDFLCTSPFTEKGFSIRYDYGKKKKWLNRRNPLSQGQAMNNMLNALRVARKVGGMKTDPWENFLHKACKVHADRILSQDWHPVSTNEGFLIAPLIQASSLLGNKSYLKAAQKAAEHYMERHMSMDEPYWGGTLDARC
ncbi:MAG: hypothetical protein HQL32_18100, partial [Planctomycetes bacterium]|nr:hypothetical protein [Planctomycetota bacterium]